MSSPRSFRWAALAALGFTMAVIVWGGYVRASGSGAGCGAHWPNCNGEVIPFSPSVKTIIEFTHRVTSALASFAVLALVVLGWRQHPRGHAARRLAGWSLFFMLLEGAAGAFLVKRELVADNASASRAVAMSVHLIITFFLVASMASTAWVAFRGERPALPPSGLQRPSGWLALAMVMAVGISGAVAALGDTLVQQSVVSPVVDALVSLRIFHPLIAIGATLAVVLLVTQSWGASPRHAGLVGALLVLQVCAGLVNVALAAPIWMQLVHLTLADTLWISLVLLTRVGGASASVPSAPLQVRLD
jgi:heme A synthase